MSAKVDDGFFLDTRLLRDHVPEIKEERRTADYLRSCVRNMMDFGDPSLRPSYNSVLDTVETLEAYFGRMADAIEDVAFNAEVLYREIEMMIRDDADKVQSLNDRTMI